MWQKGQTPVPGYRLEKFLGRGNFGEVWQSTSPGGTRCALKFLNLQQKQGRKEFRALQHLKQIRHANLMPINAMWLLDERQQVIPDANLDAAQPIMEDTVRRTLIPTSEVAEADKPKTLVIAMPLAESNLLELLHQRKASGEDIPVDELLVYMMDAARALDFLNSPRHDLGEGLVAVQHGDVKPENLVLLGGSVVLCDFGVARTLGGTSDTRGTSLGGSWAYIAPECLNGEISPHSDQFSLAISYVELRTGSLPFPEDSVAQVVEDRRKGQLWLDDLPPAEQQVIRKACSVKPEKRFRSNVEMVEAIKLAALGGPQPAKRRNWLAFTSMSALLLIAGVFAWKTFFAEPKSEPVIPPPPPVATGRELYAKAMLTLKSSPVTAAQLETATQLYIQALDADFQAEVPQPRRTGVQLNETSRVYDIVALRAVTKLFAVHPTSQRVLIVGGDGRSLVEPADDAKDTVIPLDLTAPIASIDWLDENHLLVRDCATQLWRVDLDNNHKEQISSGVLRVASAPLRGLAVAVTDGSNGTGEVITIDGSSQRTILPQASGLSIFTPLISLDESGKWLLLDEEIDRDGTATLLATDGGQAALPIKTAIRPFCMVGLQSGGAAYAVVGGESPEVPAGLIVIRLNDQRITPLAYADAESKDIFAGRVSVVRSLAAKTLTKDGGRTLIAAGQEATQGIAETGLWEMDTSGQVKLLGTVGQPKTESVSAIAVDADGEWIVCGTEYGEVTLTKLNDLSLDFQLSTMDYLADAIQLQITSDKIICAFDDASVLIWNFNECKMVFEACKQKAISLPKPQTAQPLQG